MDNELMILLNNYIECVNCMCTQLLKSLGLNTKKDYCVYIQKHRLFEHEVSGILFRHHGAGCTASDGKLYLDWNFGYGSRWCGIDPWLFSRTLEHNRDSYIVSGNHGHTKTVYYDGGYVRSMCLQAVADGRMYEKYNLFYFTIPKSETFEPDFPDSFDTLIVEHFGSRWVIPRNKVVERFMRKSRYVYNRLADSPNLHTLRFLLDGREVYNIPYDDICYPEHAVRIMNELLVHAACADIPKKPD